MFSRASITADQEFLAAWSGLVFFSPHLDSRSSATSDRSLIACFARHILYFRKRLHKDPPGSFSSITACWEFCSVLFSRVTFAAPGHTVLRSASPVGPLDAGDLCVEHLAVGDLVAGPAPLFVQSLENTRPKHALWGQYPNH